MRDDFTVANEQIGLAQSTVQLLQPPIRNGGKDVVLEVILHPGPHEVILQPPCVTGPGDPVHGVRLAQARIEMLGDRLQAKDHRVHADDRHEPEDHVEQDSPEDPLKEDELPEDYQLCDNFTHQELRSWPAGWPVHPMPRRCPRSGWLLSGRPSLRRDPGAGDLSAHHAEHGTR